MTIEIAAVVGQIVTFLTVIVGFVYQYLRESRRHRWDAEQRREIAAEALAAIENNTEVSREAFKEANDVNLKIHALGLDARLRKDNYVVANDGA